MLSRRNGWLVAVGSTAAITAYSLLSTTAWFERHGASLARVDFDTEIRPILNQNCVACHGGVKQAGGVSFVYRDEALGSGKSGRPTIVPGNPAASELMTRITSPDREVRMPYHAPALAPRQVELLRQWILEGANWQEYWAFVPPQPQVLPDVREKQWPRGVLDHFILARLEQEGLAHSPEATRPELLRRLSFDLTGLPPSPAEIDAFLADTEPGAYERQVDRLLASPRYGERWAVPWLDQARYADSAGYESDPGRPAWPYRDWVVDALNRNLPYDQFVITQLAGDLLPGAGYDERIATIFHRLTPVNYEGGTDDEEFRVTAVMDRVATTWQALNGLTMNCVQCHSHPYDPIRHEDYYRFMAFLNTTRDADLDEDAPNIRVPFDYAQRRNIGAREAERAALRSQLVDAARALAGESAWQPLAVAGGTVTEFPEPSRPGYTPPPHPLAGTQPMRITPEGVAETTGTVATYTLMELRSAQPAGTVTALRIEVPPADADAARRVPEDGFVVNDIRAWLVDAHGRAQLLDFAAWGEDSVDNFEYGKRLPYRLLLGPGGFSAYSKLWRTRWTIGVLRKPLAVPAGATIRLQLKHMQQLDYRPAVARRVRLSTSGDARWTRWPADNAVPAKLARLHKVEREIAWTQGVYVPVMVEQHPYERRETFELERGNLRRPVGPPLEPGVPAIFPPLPEGAPRNRLTMARWFFQPGQPLTARVAVNRCWEQVFGTGLVETLENFGGGGERPSHPELLDWLALHFENDLHWDQKALLRELVTSATYRQSARLAPELAQRDPRNRLLARGPQQRLGAEMVRDQALAASGLLSEARGGPPVMPPQPAGVWMTVYDGGKWREAQGPDRYRRALYTFLKRSSIYPSFLLFDASARSTALPRRIATNTPLQALVLLNDPVYQEAAAALGKGMLALREAPAEAGAAGGLGDLFAARANYAARRVLSRGLEAPELAMLQHMHDEVLQLPASGGGGSEAAALAAVAGVLLNLDAAMTR